MSNEALKPCPFCGGEAHLDGGLGVWCDNDKCAIVGQVFSGGISHWNQRALASLPEGAERWISVEERLPPQMQRVLCIHRDSGDIDIWRRRNDDGWEWANVSHWMPLPNPPGAAIDEATKP